MSNKPFIYKGDPIALQYEVYAGNGTGNKTGIVDLTGRLIYITLSTSQNVSLSGYVSGVSVGGDLVVSVSRNTISVSVPSAMSARLPAGKLSVLLRIGKAAGSGDTYTVSYSPLDIIDPLAPRNPDDICQCSNTIIIEGRTFVSTLIIEQQLVAGVSIDYVTILSTGEIHIALDNGQTLRPGLIKGADGKSAYQSAVEAGYSGTEEQWLASLHGHDGITPQIDLYKNQDDTYDLVLSSSEDAERIPNIVTFEAISRVTGNLTAAADAATDAAKNARSAAQQAQNFVSNADITGVDTSLGRYAVRAESVLTQPGDHTIQLVVRTPLSVVPTTQWLMLHWMGGDGVQIGIYPGSGQNNLLQVLFCGSAVSRNTPCGECCAIVLSVRENLMDVYINGCLVAKDRPKGTTTFSQFLFYLSHSNPEQRFDGIIHLCRIFNRALSIDEALRLWHDGNPLDYRLPATMEGCIGEFLPAGLYEGGWRDNSGNGNNLPSIDAPRLTRERPCFPRTLYGEGTPAAAPQFIGQYYIDISSRTIYMGAGAMSASEWIIAK